MSDSSKKDVKNKIKKDKGEKQSPVLRWLPLFGIGVCIVLAIIAWQNGLLTDEDALEAFVKNAGVFGFVVFILIQIVQVIIPILPGGVTCLVGVVLYGPIFGFIANYIGICVGSILGFIIARIYGRGLLLKLFGEEKLSKYDKWTREGKTFSVLFAIAMFLPGLPDDMICYLAGTTDMTFLRYTVLLLVFKIAPIALYSLLPLLGLSDKLSTWLTKAPRIPLNLSTV